MPYASDKKVDQSTKTIKINGVVDCYGGSPDCNPGILDQLGSIPSSTTKILEKCPSGRRKLSVKQLLTSRWFESNFLHQNS